MGGRTPDNRRRVRPSERGYRLRRRPVMPREVRELVHTLLYGDASDIGLSRSWADHAVAQLPVGDRAVAKLALLTALASYQGDDVVATARRACADDAALIDLTAWASLAAARRAASRYLHTSRRAL